MRQLLMFMGSGVMHLDEPKIIHEDFMALKLIPRIDPISPHVFNISCKTATDADNSNRSSAYMIQPIKILCT